MGTGKNRLAAVCFVGALVAMLWLDTEASGAKERHSGIWQVLRAGHFSGAMNEDAHVRSIAGSIAVNGKRYSFMEFSWEETPKNMTGSSPHGQNRLLVFGGADKALTYLGSYTFDAHPFHGRVRPEIRGETVFFPYKDIEIMGVKIPKEISFANGPPAASNVGEVYSEFYR